MVRGSAPEPRPGQSGIPVGPRRHPAPRRRERRTRVAGPRGLHRPGHAAERLPGADPRHVRHRLQSYAASAVRLPISMRRGLALSASGSVSSSMPFAKCASTRSASTLAGNVKARSKRP